MVTCLRIYLFAMILFSPCHTVIVSAPGSPHSSPVCVTLVSSVTAPAPALMLRLNSAADNSHKSQVRSSWSQLTCSLQSSDSLHLLEDRGEGVGDDGDHDHDGEHQDDHSRHDQLHILYVEKY